MRMRSGDWEDERCIGRPPLPPHGAPAHPLPDSLPHRARSSSPSPSEGVDARGSSLASLETEQREVLRLLGLGCPLEVALREVHIGRLQAALHHESDETFRGTLGEPDPVLLAHLRRGYTLRQAAKIHLMRLMQERDTLLSRHMMDQTRRQRREWDAEGALRELLSMGFRPDQCDLALQQCGADLQRAACWLVEREARETRGSANNNTELRGRRRGR